MRTQWFPPKEGAPDGASLSDPESHVPAALQNILLDCQGLSDQGPGREANEDHFLMAGLRWGGTGALFLSVADGLGGEAAGERASRVAAQAVLEALKSGAEDGRPPEAIFRSALLSAHLHVLADSRDDAERQGMATTLTAALVLWPKAYVAHVGDSRCYRFRGGRAECLTVDHTVSQQLVDAGCLGRRQAQESEDHDVLWNYLGGGQTVPEPFIRSIELLPGDSLLLATDGLTKSFSDRELGTLAAHPRTAWSHCRRLVETARVRGSLDDATAVFARFGHSEVPSHAGKRRFRIA